MVQLSIRGLTLLLTDYNPYLLAEYRLPTVRSSDNRWFQTWAEVKTGFVAGTNPTSFSLGDTTHGYPFIASAAAAMVAQFPGGGAAWQIMETQVLSSSNLNLEPKWAIR